MATNENNKSSNSKNESDGKMTVQEAGHLGGEQTSKTHDRSFYEEIGSEGGKVSPGNFKNDPERAAEAGSHSHDNDGKREDSDRKAA
jgi:general stress protein YciG